MRLLRSMPQPGVQTERKNRSDLHPRGMSVKLKNL